MRYPVGSFHDQIVPSQIVPSQIVPLNSQIVPQKCQFVPHFFFTIKSHVKFSKCVIVIWVQSNDRKLDESIFRNIYIIVRACVRLLISLRIAERCQSVRDSSESLINDESSFTWSRVCVDPNYFIFPYIHLSIDPCKHCMLNSDSLY